jgi:predicted PurR-regulated permease PerM
MADLVGDKYMTQAGPRTTSSWMPTLASAAIIIAALYMAKSLLVPLTLAVLLSFLLMPLCDWLERSRMSRIPAVLLTAILGFTTLGILAWITVVQISHLAPKMSEYQQNIHTKLSSVNEYAAGALSKITKQAAEVAKNPLAKEHSDEPQGTTELPFSVRVLSSPPSPLQVFGGIFGTLLEGLGTIGIVIVLVVFFLIRREDLRDRFIHLVGKGHVTVTTQMMQDANHRVSRYLSLLFVVNVAFGMSVGIGLYLIGVPSAILWGILAAALRFVPYIGAWIAAAMPLALSLATPGWAAPILTLGLFVALELINGNVLEPWLYGKHTGVSPVAILVAAVFWLWLWGPVGLLLATPLTVCLLVIGKHVPQLSFLDVLLGNEPVFEPYKRIYQRLVAGDQEEADELLDELLQDQPLVEVYDTVLLPALGLVQIHWQRGEFNDGKHKFIMQSLKEMLQDRAEQPSEAEVQNAAENGQSTSDDANVGARDLPKTFILSLPARDEGDEIAAMMLEQVLRSSRCDIQAISTTSLASELVDIIERRKPDLICINATPPAATMHARYLCRQLRRRFPKVKLVVGLWGIEGDLTKPKNRIGCGAHVVATMAEARQHLGLLIPDLASDGEQRVPQATNQFIMQKGDPIHYPQDGDARKPLHQETLIESVDSQSVV